MSEWLDLMLEEIARKRHEEDEALEELERRKLPPQDEDTSADGPTGAQTK
jgi:hypothetical protein